MDHNYYWYWNKEIPHETCQKIINLGKEEWNQAQTFGSVEKNKPLDNVRKSDVAWINDQWVYDLIWGYMSRDLLMPGALGLMMVRKNKNFLRVYLRFRGALPCIAFHPMVGLGS